MIKGSHIRRHSVRSIAITLMLLLAFGQVAHFAGHLLHDHAEFASVTSIDLAAAYLPHDVDIDFSLSDCEHQHGHDGQSVTLMMAAFIAPNLSGSNFNAQFESIHYPITSDRIESQRAPSGPDQPPQTYASA